MYKVRTYLTNKNVFSLETKQWKILGKPAENKKGFCTSSFFFFFCMAICGKVISLWKNKVLDLDNCPVGCPPTLTLSKFLKFRYFPHFAFIFSP